MKKLAVILSAGLLVSCNQEESAWQGPVRTTTQEAYERNCANQPEHDAVGNPNSELFACNVIAEGIRTQIENASDYEEFIDDLTEAFVKVCHTPGNTTLASLPGRIAFIRNILELVDISAYSGASMAELDQLARQIEEANRARCLGGPQDS